MSIVWNDAGVGERQYDCASLRQPLAPPPPFLLLLLLLLLPLESPAVCVCDGREVEEEEHFDGPSR